jgi:hypothetical protein
LIRQLQDRFNRGSPGYVDQFVHRQPRLFDQLDHRQQALPVARLKNSANLRVLVGSLALS